MTTTNKVYPLNLFITSGHVELLRLQPKSSGFVAYLPHDVIRFLNLDPETKSLIAFLDDTGPYNFLIITSDRYLSKLLKPLILEKRRRGEEMKQRLKTQLQQQSPAEAEKVSLDVYER